MSNQINSLGTTSYSPQKEGAGGAGFGSRALREQYSSAIPIATNPLSAPTRALTHDEYTQVI